VTGTDVAAIIGAIALLVTSIGGLIVSVRSSRRVAEVKVAVDENRLTVNDTHAMVTQVDAAVNGKPPGATTMVSQVQDLHDETFPRVDENGDALLPLVRRLVVQMEAHIEAAKERDRER